LAVFIFFVGAEAEEEWRAAVRMKMPKSEWKSVRIVWVKGDTQTTNERNDANGLVDTAETAMIARCTGAIIRYE
jgi:adenylylsulfate kinase-like enzyme